MDRFLIYAHEEMKKKKEKPTHDIEKCLKVAISKIYRERGFKTINHVERRVFITINDVCYKERL